MKKNFLIKILLLLTISLQAQTHPFPQHVPYNGTYLKPSGYTQEELDKTVTDFYYLWKTKYLKNSCGSGQYFISFDGGNACVSEGQGYGMMIIPLMAGYDANAKIYFDGLYKYYKAHPSNINSNLMAWKQENCTNVDGADAASDGDIDIAYGLLLAHVQWGSNGDINYLQEAKNIINAIMNSEINNSLYIVRLGDWATSDKYDASTRTSDFIMDHFRIFQCAVNDNKWNQVVDTCYSLIDKMQSKYSPQTGLLPDFIVDADTGAKPAPANFLEGENDGNYAYNACRDPWRIATDYLSSGDDRAKTAVNKINNWLISKCNNNPDNIKSGYKLDGTETATWDDPAFTGPFTVGAMLQDNQQWLDDIYAKLLSYNFNDDDYYSNSLKMLNLLVISGNYWSPGCNELVTGINDLKKTNPTIQIVVNQDCLIIKNTMQEYKASIIDLNGKILKSFTVNHNNFEINISDLAKSCYVLKLYKQKTKCVYTGKFVVR